ncbi:MAG: Zn-ribbon domain-containing OB-fold protein [bacterium]|nr:Zn-ribbon domain-containing OB-fold protein [bacterium]
MFEWFGKKNFCAHTKVDGFAAHLRDGRLMGSTCTECGQLSFPPRSDCSACHGGEFTFTELSGRGTLLTFTSIDAAPAGFENDVPFFLGVIDLEESGRLLASFGQSIQPDDIAIDMPVQVVPRLIEESEDIKVHYTLEKPGTRWVKTNFYQGEK